MLYAFAGTEAPSRWFTLLPGLLSPSQEDDYISDLRRTDPAYIAVTARNTSEHGAPYFGVDYNQKILRWIEANYVVDREFGGSAAMEAGSLLPSFIGGAIFRNRRTIRRLK